MFTADELEVLAREWLDDAAWYLRRANDAEKQDEIAKAVSYRNRAIRFAKHATYHFAVARDKRLGLIP